MRLTRIAIAIYAAAITGWFWRIGVERWPTWQPPLFMAGVIILTLLVGWLSRSRGDA